MRAGPGGARGDPKIASLTPQNRPPPRAHPAHHDPGGGGAAPGDGGHPGGGDTFGVSWAGFGGPWGGLGVAKDFGGRVWGTPRMVWGCPLWVGFGGVWDTLNVTTGLGGALGGLLGFPGWFRGPLRVWRESLGGDLGIPRMVWGCPLCVGSGGDLGHPKCDRRLSGRNFGVPLEFSRGLNSPQNPPIFPSLPRGSSWIRIRSRRSRWRPRPTGTSTLR